MTPSRDIGNWIGGGGGGGGGSRWVAAALGNPEQPAAIYMSRLARAARKRREKENLLL